MVNWSVISGKYSLIKDKCNQNFTFISTIITTDNTDAECHSGGGTLKARKQNGTTVNTILPRTLDCLKTNSPNTPDQKLS